MKKIWILLVILFLLCSLIGCGESKTTPVNSNTTNNTSIQKSEPTQTELNNQLKKEAVKADFVKLNGHEDEYKNEKVFLEGQVTTIIQAASVGGEFTVSIKEGNGFGMYGITSFDTENNYEVGKDINKGDKVKVYGTIDGKDKFGFPHINATIIEK